MGVGGGGSRDSVAQYTRIVRDLKARTARQIDAPSRRDPGLLAFAFWRAQKSNEENWPVAVLQDRTGVAHLVSGAHPTYSTALKG